MRQDNLLQQAIRAAREGREWTARDLFLRVTQAEPHNEVAWMWLAGLLENLDERIDACERILLINPRNEKVREYLQKLLSERQTALQMEQKKTEENLMNVKSALRRGEKDSALAELRQMAIQPRMDNPQVWQLLADLTPELNERVRALERLTELLPHDEKAKEELNQARYFQAHPIHQAELYEERGEIEKALFTYHMIALNPESKEQWNHVYWKIVHLEKLKQEKIVHVSPVLNIARLTAGPPIVYFMFALVHVGINPFAHNDPFVWLAMLWVILGSFMVAVASVPSHHRFWKIIFNETAASGTPRSRRMTAAAGWALILMPFLIMFIDASNRMIDFIILNIP